MKNRVGVIIGSILGLTILSSVLVLYSQTDCFSCGFMGVDHCSSYEGICPLAGGYVNVITLFSLPFVFLSVVVGAMFNLFEYLDLIHLIWFFSVLYVLYWSVVGYLFQKKFFK